MHLKGLLASWLAGASERKIMRQLARVPAGAREAAITSIMIDGRWPTDKPELRGLRRSVSRPSLAHADDDSRLYTYKREERIFIQY